MIEGIRWWCVSIGFGGCVRRVISVSFCISMMLLGCLSVIFFLSLVMFFLVLVFYFGGGCGGYEMGRRFGRGI